MVDELHSPCHVISPSAPLIPGTTILVTFACSPVVVDPDITAGDFTVAFNSDSTTGKLDISLTGAQTGAISQGRYVYDVLITSGASAKTRVVEGIATFNPRVTQ